LLGKDSYFENYVDQAGGVTQVVEHLPSKFEALSSNSSTENRIKQNKITLNRSDKVKEDDACILTVKKETNISGRSEKRKYILYF
jgi:hypothetical protein